jgi:hypothetical protein
MAVGPERTLNNLQGKVPLQGGITNGNEEESCEESRQKEKAVTDPGVAFSLAVFVSLQRPPRVVCGGLLILHHHPYCGDPSN